MPQLIKMTKKDEMKETIEILQNKDLMDQIRESEDNKKKGIKFRKLDV